MIKDGGGDAHKLLKPLLDVVNSMAQQRDKNSMRRYCTGPTGSRTVALFQ